MKIATLTFHGSHNYGSVLQAYALSKQLELMGNEVEILNLRPQSQKNMYSLNKKSSSIVYKIFVAFYNEDHKKWEVQEPVKAVAKKTTAKKTTRKSTAKKTTVRKTAKKA